MKFKELKVGDKFKLLNTGGLFERIEGVPYLGGSILPLLMEAKYLEGKWKDYECCVDDKSEVELI